MTFALLLTALVTPAIAQDIKPHQLTPLPIQQVVIQDDFWSPKLKVWREVTIADCFAKFENDRGAPSATSTRSATAPAGEHGGPAMV